MTKITIDRAVVEQALDALTPWADSDHTVQHAAYHALRAALAEPTTCAWHGDEDGAYETSCKRIFQMLDGTPQENDFTHCCFCGKKLAQKLITEDEDD